MASATVKRDISTILLLVLSITGVICGLPLAEIHGENRDGQIAQPNGQQMFPADMPPPPQGAFNDPGQGELPSSKLPEPPSGDIASLSNDGLVVNPPAEAAGEAGTGLTMMAAVVPDANTGDMFPDNMPPPPQGALNDMVPAEGQVLPANNGDMFPVNMPPPPQGAVNDAVLDIEKKVEPVNIGSMFPVNMPLPPQGAVNDIVPAEGQVVPANNDGMFPVNMPPPPQGAVNDMVPTQEQVVPAKNGGMFPDNMPPPPPGAFNDGVAPPTEQEIAPLEIEMNQDNIVPPNKDIASPPYRDMFPPNMPPPPPGAFNEPLPIPKLKQKAYPAVISAGTDVKPTYVNGTNVPDAAVPSNQQYVGTANGPNNAPQYQPVTSVSNHPNTPYSQADGNPQALSPNTQDNPGEGQAQYNPDDPNNLDASNKPSPTINDQPVESVQNKNEGQIPYNPDELDASQKSPNPSSANNKPAESFPNQNVAPVNPIVTEADNVNENPSESPSESTGEPSYESFGESLPYEGEQNKVQGDSQEWSPEASDTYSAEEEVSFWEESESESDYSFMNWKDSSDYESTDSFNGGDVAPENSLEDSESEPYDSSYLENSSDYSELEWIFNGGSSMAAGSETSEEEEEEEEDYFGLDQTQETGSHGEDQKQTFPNEFMGENDMYRTGGTKLIMYCIPALILCVLILLAWKNYRGRIRVVSVHSVDTKQYDWKTDRKSEEHAPMLLDQDHEEKGY